MIVIFIGDDDIVQDDHEKKNYHPYQGYHKGLCQFLKPGFPVYVPVITGKIMQKHPPNGYKKKAQDEILICLKRNGIPKFGRFNINLAVCKK